MAHIFGRACDENGIERRETKVNHPWTNGQVERMNRTIKDATVRRYHDGSHKQLRQHVQDFIAACNYARRLETLRGLTPFELIAKQLEGVRFGRVGPNRTGAGLRTPAPLPNPLAPAHHAWEIREC